MEAVCLDCSFLFVFDPAFYAGRGLAVPSRCRSCRAARRAARVRRRGFVDATGRRFSLLRADDGALYFANAYELNLEPGERVVFDVDPSERPPAGRRPHAYDVARE